MAAKLISVVVPVYCEEENLRPFHQAVSDVFATLEGRCDLELIFVDDGSSDGSLQILRELTEADPRVAVVSLSRNFGHQAAITAGLEHANGDAVVTMDGDFQDPPEVIPRLIDQWEQGVHVVYARRGNRSDKLLKKSTAALFYRMMSKISDVEIPEQVGDFRLMDRIVLQNLLRFDEHSRYLRGMVAWLGFSHVFVDYDRPERLHGEAHYTVRKMAKLAMDGMLNFTFTPLRLCVWVGLTAVILSVGFMAYMLYDHFVRGVPYMLYKWLVVALFGFVGLQFTFLWVIGEYIGRIYNDVRRRPIYVVKEKLNLRP